MCVDTSPVMDKVWAQRGGLGWIGKHTNLISRNLGSWLFLGELILDLELEYDTPFEEDLCGSCIACIESCPTQALDEYKIDAGKCISYLTIEHRGELPESQSDLHGWIYGCDICQEVCPWNQKSSIISEQESFQPRTFLIENNINYLYDLSDKEYSVLFKNSAMKRTKLKGLKRNIDFVR